MAVLGTTVADRLRTVGRVAAGDGNGWVSCRCGARHWGLHGAAGLLLVRRCAPGDGLRTAEVLLQLRAEWTHEGGTWGIPGGAVDSHETRLQGALREAHEETGVRPDAVRVLESLVSADHVDWQYHVVLGTPAAPITPHAATAESHEVRWVPLGVVPALPLHPAFALSWPVLRQRLGRATG